MSSTHRVMNFKTIPPALQLTFKEPFVQMIFVVAYMALPP